MIVDCAIYVDGRRSAPCSIGEIHEASLARGGFAWIDLYEPTQEEFDSVAGEFGLHQLALGDAVKMHQRPKIERYGDLIFVVLKSARYVEEEEKVEFGELHAFVGRDFIVTVRHGDASELKEVRRQVEGRPDLLRRGPSAVLFATMFHIVEDYGPVVEGLENDVDEIEVQVFGGTPGASPDVSRRIYELSREVIQFHQATQPLAGTLGRLTGGDTHDIDPEVRRYLRDVYDHVERVIEQVEGFQGSLANILNVNLTMVTVRQNNQVRKISAWAAILIVPTIVSGIYGMNYQHMPELDWRFGYPYALILMAAICVGLYLAFKRARWL